MNKKPERVIMTRSAVGKEGRSINLLSNHFHATFTSSDSIFYHYTVSMKYDNEKLVENKRTSSKVMEKMFHTYSSELGTKDYIYDGERSLFIVGPLPQNILQFTIVLEETSARAMVIRGSGSRSEGDEKRLKRVRKTSLVKVVLTYASEVPLCSLAVALKGGESTCHAQSALMVLNAILRQQQATSNNFAGSASASNKYVQGWLSGKTVRDHNKATLYDTRLHVATTLILTPGPVISFLISNQNVEEPRQVDWVKAKRMLKNIRIKTRHNKMEHKIIGFSELPCNRQKFPLTVREDDGECRTVEVTVSEYYKKRYQLDLSWSSSYPCLDVGKPRRPIYLPLELCELIPLQRYIKALSSKQRASLVENSRQKPQERRHTIIGAVRSNKYDEDPILAACGIQIEKQMTRLTGRILPAPRLIFGNGVECIPDRGRWNVNNKIVLEPVEIGLWAVVNFSTRVDMNYVSSELIACGRRKGIHIDRPHALIKERSRYVGKEPVVRVQRMFEELRKELSTRPQFVLCILPKTNDLYGPWKKKSLQELGIATQCMCPGKHNELYFGNLLLKINVKLGGMNSVLAWEDRNCIPMVQQKPTLILGLDVSHGSAGQYDRPSIAAVVGSRCWPSISKYRASVRTQSPKIEMIDSLCMPKPNGYEDDGIIREMLLDFYQSTSRRKPEQIIIFRDGVSQNQFNQVLNVEVDQIMQAYEMMGEGPLPKVTVIVAQKNHHTKLFQADNPQNVPPGTVVDTTIVHSRNYDFYMCSHNGMIGTSRPAHYHVLVDEIGFAVDNLQQFIHSLSYAYQRSTTAISIVAPIAYAHLAAAQASQFIKYDDYSDASSGSGEIAPVPKLPCLHPDVRNSMFFC